MFLRPHIAEMLERVSQYFDICIYTASERVYADSILDQLDPDNLFLSNRLYRESCTLAKLENGAKVVYLKDLRLISSYSLDEIVIVDNSLLSFALQPENGVPISSFFSDPDDQELRCLADYLCGKVAKMKDVRDANIQEFNIQAIIDMALQSQLAKQTQQENLSPKTSR